jgi:hypothetical protein
MVIYICNPTYSGGIGKRIVTQGWPRQEHKTTSEKQTKNKMTMALHSVVEHFPSKHKALNSIPSSQN